jgi:hypothetical protein
MYGIEGQPMQMMMGSGITELSYIKYSVITLLSHVC